MKTYETEPMQNLLLLDLLSREGEALLKEIKKPEYDLHKHRQPLIRQGLMVEAKKRPIVNGKPKGKELVEMSLTDEAYPYLAKLMDEGANLPASPACGSVSARLLKIVSRFMKANGCTVSDVFNDPPRRLPSPTGNGDPQGPEGGDVPVPPPPPPEPPKPIDPVGFYRRLRSIPKRLFMAGGGLRIAVLRKAVPDVPREETDRLLIELQRQGRIVLYEFSSPDMITDEDREAAVMVGGVPRHVMYFK
ncbi:MAG: hypothetical protein LBW85_04625 [Deltaproteobacteria bacterium]|jgi:hypothetical protein|nr:hypothetical protein [Deltaproteobacteria bacterium]